MRERAAPSSLIFLALLVAVAIVAALAAGGAIYAETRSASRTRAEAMTRGVARAGQHAIARYGCGSCHVIPGITDASGTVGPGLAHVALRSEIAGVLSNDPEAMVRWLRHPQAVRPGNGMPEQGVTERDARDIAAYLYAGN